MTTYDGGPTQEQFERALQPPTTDDYAEYLVALVRRDQAEEPERFGRARSWADLHDVCDANEYLIDADEHFGLSEADFADRLIATNTAIEIAERKLGWKGATT